MCHLVSWKQTPKSSAELMVPQHEIFVNEDQRSSADAATEKAEKLALTEGITEVRLWKLLGDAKPKTSVEWQQS